MESHPSTTFGNTSMAWLVAAGGLPGKALYVGVAVWHESGLRRDSAEVAINLSRIARELGCDRTTAGRGLADLERRGLVAVQRRRGRCPRVTLLPAPGLE